MKKDNDYTVTDLSRALIRQYLTQKGLRGTLQSFEREDKHNKKKINRNLLIEMTSLKTLCLINKRLPDSQSSLLEVLVAYLNKKYQVKQNTFTKTEPQFYHKNQNASNPIKYQTAQLTSNKYAGKQRPSTSKPNKSKQDADVKPAQNFQKEELKVIYTKVTKVEEQTKSKHQAKAELKEKEEKKEILPERNRDYTEQIKDEKKIESLPSEKEQKKNQPNIYQEIKSVNPPVVQVMEIQQDYQQQFQEDQAIPYIETAQQPTYFIVKEDFQPPLPKIDEERFESSIGPSYVQSKTKGQADLPIQTAQKQKQPETKIQEQSIDNLKEGRTIVGAFKENERNNEHLYHDLSEEKLNPIPCLYPPEPKIQQPQNNLSNNHQDNMGCIVEKEEIKKELPNIIEEEPKIPDTKIKQKCEAEPEQSNKPRTPMRLLGKGKSNKKIQTVEQQQTKNIVNPRQGEKKDDKKIEKLQETEKVSQEKKDTPKQISIEETKPKESKPQVMVAIGKKKKNKEESIQQYPTKFKFDDNFSHGIVTQAKYQYQPYEIGQFVIEEKVQELYPSLVIETGINYKVKGGAVPPLKKKQEKGITSKDAEILKKTIFQSGPAVLPKAWTQGFILSPFQSTPYGLKQIEGGPCGVIAAVQCYYLKHLLYCFKQESIYDLIVREVCLVAALTDLLYKVKSTDKIILAFPPRGSSKIDINNLKISVIDANDFKTAFSGLWAYREEFIGEKNFGVASLLYSVVLTKGSDKIEEEIDVKENPLIGNHGHCTQQFVNLVLTGKASSNCFDGEKIIDDYKIRGIVDRSQFGFLTVFQTLRYIEVGKHLKNPVFPVWVICKEFHYHVIFGHSHLVAQNNKTEKFDIIYFDGLYNCGDKIRLTLSPLTEEQVESLKPKELPLIEQVMMTKWGPKRADWNGSTKIL